MRSLGSRKYGNLLLQALFVDHQLSDGFCISNWCFEWYAILGNEWISRPIQEVQSLEISVSPLSSLEQFLNVKKVHPSTKRASLLLITTALMERAIVYTCNIRGQRHPHCLVEQSPRGDSFAFLKDAIENFIVQSIFFTIIQGPNFTAYDTNQPKTAYFFTTFVSVSKGQFRGFQRKCNETMNTKT